MSEIFAWLSQNGFSLFLAVAIIAYVGRRRAIDLSDMPTDLTLTIRHEHYQMSGDDE